MQLSGKQGRIIIGLCLALILLVLGCTQFGQRFAMAICRPFVHLWNEVANIAKTEPQETKDETIKRLTLELRLNELDLAAAQELKRQNDQLRTALGLKPFPKWNVIQAEVLTHDPVAWDLIFTIDKGEADGIIPGAVVIAEKAVVGRVVACNQHSAIINTVISTNCRVGVYFASSEATGLLRGMGTLNADDFSGCLVDFIPPETAGTPGEQVLTSGLGGALPAGLPVGTLVSNANGEVFQTIDHARKRALVKPLADIMHVRFVSVIVPK